MRVWSSFTVILVAQLAVAQQLPSQPLFTTVDAATAEHVMRPTNYDLRDELYFARRYAIVEVNFQLLEKEQAVVNISPWDDLSVEVVAEAVSGPASFSGNRQWRGRLVSPVPAAVARETDPDKLQAVERLLSFSLWITAKGGTFDLPLARQGTQLRLRPIESYPRYHVVYELDPSKMAFGPQAEANRKRYARFREELDRERKARPPADVTN